MVIVTDHVSAFRVGHIELEADGIAKKFIQGRSRGDLEHLSLLYFIEEQDTFLWSEELLNPPPSRAALDGSASIKFLPQPISIGAITGANKLPDAIPFARIQQMDPESVLAIRSEYFVDESGHALTGLLEHSHQLEFARVSVIDQRCFHDRLISW